MSSVGYYDPISPHLILWCTHVPPQEIESSPLDSYNLRVNAVSMQVRYVGKAGYPQIIIVFVGFSIINRLQARQSNTRKFIFFDCKFERKYPHNERTYPQTSARIPKLSQISPSERNNKNKKWLTLNRSIRDHMGWDPDLSVVFLGFWVWTFSGTCKPKIS